MKSATNRELQKLALEELALAFPEKVNAQTFFNDEPRENVAAVLAYLEQHGLVRVDWSKEIGGPARPVQAAITAKGIDFIADDGGLGAILGVVTVKLHDETLRELLANAVENSPVEPSVKAHMVEQIRRLPAEGLKELTMAAAKAGVAATPTAIAMMRGYLGV